MKKLIVLMIAALAVGVGCENKPEAAPAAPAKPAETAKEAAKPTADPGPGTVAQANLEDDVTTEVDFEVEAEKEIDDKSVDSEVDKLAKEIGE